MSHNSQTEQGFMTLIMVLVTGAIALAIVSTLVVLGVDLRYGSLTRQQSAQARALADLCAEEALQQIRSSIPFTGSNTLNIGSGTCTYSVTSQGGAIRVVQASSTVATVVRKVKVQTSKLAPKIEISLWQELSDF